MAELLKKDRPIILIEFSYSCLNRAGFSPEKFADEIKENFAYDFTFVVGNRLELIKDQTPKDGYYFLIPNEKINDFQSILN